MHTLAYTRTSYKLRDIKAIIGKASENERKKGKKKFKTKRKTNPNEKRVLCIRRVNLNVPKLNFLFNLDGIKLLNVYCLWYAGIADNNT